MRTLIIAGIILIVGLIVLSQSLYVVDETEQVIITRFGEVQDTINSPGLNVKAPFVDTVVRFDKRHSESRSEIHHQYLVRTDAHARED